MRVCRTFSPLLFVLGDFKANIIYSLEPLALNFSHQINITSTGDLDCVDFAERVANMTEWPVDDEDPANWNSSVVCNSNKASVTMHPVPPSAPEGSTGSRSGLGFYGNSMLLIIFVAGASWVI